ncbi:Altered inheritance of mitochondria protein 6 [Taxawa tesnikishii (nom. ined.)]|nr:Altered inheritance of mitochondria protein 6 [Dothideales sp. JES 119]
MTESAVLYVRAVNRVPSWLEPRISAYSKDDPTRNIKPIPCHSHNDYKQPVPLFDALHTGCTGVEADVWLFDGELYVGHTVDSLTPNRTLHSLYIDPLLKLLDARNNHGNSSSWTGLYSQDPTQTVVLLIDIKSDGFDTFPHVSRQLSDLRSRGYLTHFNGTHTIPGPITVIGSGSTPFDLVVADPHNRDIFFDAPAWISPSFNSPPYFPASPRRRQSQAHSTPGPTGKYESDMFDNTTSWYASADLSWYRRKFHWGEDALDGLVKTIGSRGLKLRFYGVPKNVWRMLIDAGVAMVSVDDLEAAAREDWRPRRLVGLGRRDRG